MAVFAKLMNRILCRSKDCIRLLNCRLYNTDCTYEQAFEQSVKHPEQFWAEQAEQLVWFRKWYKVLDNSNAPFTKWFPGGKLNVCYNAVDRWVERGRSETTALIWDSPVTGIIRKYTYLQLQDEVSRFSRVLSNQGVRQGDRVLIYMPMIPEAIIAMLACARLGAIHIIVFGGFAAKELSVRISHSEPKVIVAASAGVEPNRVIEYKPVLDEAIHMSASKPRVSIIYQRKDVCNAKLDPMVDLDWEVEMNKTHRGHECVSVESNAPLYIIHTSGTTGLPKGVVRPTGGYAVALPWTMRAIYDMKEGETFWAASDLGWVVGHSYICYAPLLAGLTTVMYEGKPVGTPDSGQFFRVCQAHNVKTLFCAPTALRAIRQADPDLEHATNYKWDNLLSIFAAGEHLDYETRIWTEKGFGVPVLDHWWQTESGWPICSPCVGYKNPDLNPPKDASGKPAPGWDVQVMNERGKIANPGELGRIVVKEPLPPGALSTFWGNDEKFVETYFERFRGYYDTMDAGMKSEDNYVSVMSRVDDVINVAGHRISSGALEESILGSKLVVDCAVIGVEDELKGTIPLAICVVNDQFAGDLSDVSKQVVHHVRETIGAVAALKTIVFVPKLPKTRSGKIARNTLAAMACNKPYKIPVTIEDSTVYPVIRAAMQQVGLAMHSEDPL